MKTIEEVHARMLAICDKAKIVKTNSVDYSNEVRIHYLSDTAIALYIDDNKLFYNNGKLVVEAKSGNKINYTFNCDYFLDFVEKSVNNEELEFDEDKLLVDSNIRIINNEELKINEDEIKAIKEVMEFLGGVLNAQKLINKK